MCGLLLNQKKQPALYIMYQENTNMLTITTCQSYPEPPSNLLPVQAALQQRGIATQFAPWQTCPATPYILPLCAWDYAQGFDAWDTWLNQMQSAGCLFANSVDLMRWNSRKHYLLDLIRADFPVAPTQIVSAHANDIWQTMQAQSWQQAVLKPAVGQSGYGVQKIQSPQDIKLTDTSGDWLLQAYLPEVAEQGEWCLIYFAGRFSHAVRRLPAQGEWRANSAYGAQVQAACAPQIAQQTAQQVLNWLPQMPRYARIDGVMRQNQFYINEVELIEPALYWHLYPESVARFVDVVAEWVKQ